MGLEGKYGMVCPGIMDIMEAADLGTTKGLHEAVEATAEAIKCKNNGKCNKGYCPANNFGSCKL